MILLIELEKRTMSTSEPQYLYLTTIGRKSGTPHQIEIWFVAHDGAYYLVSGGGEKSDWVKNIIANPSVTVSVGKRDALVWQGTGRALYPEADAELIAVVRAQMNAKYGWSDGLLIELKPA
jgi:deazaflavin-dependent oxidoreductase (nitroreductase family)